MNAKERIKEFVIKYIQEEDFGDDVNLFEKGYVNSLFAMQLVLFVESEFGMRVDNDDLDISNFDTINHIVELIEKKSKQKVQEESQCGGKRRAYVIDG